jgi:hypothetical protein
METAIEELKVFETEEVSFDFSEIVTNGRVLHANGLIPPSLKQSLEKNLAIIADQPTKDFHPGSHGKVQDLIHPSLFPYIKGNRIIIYNL